jgi:hypothetical protein
MRKLETWWFHYYSTATFYAGIDLWVRYLTVLILAFPAVIGIVLDLTDRPLGATLCFVLFGGLLVLFAILWMIVWIYHYWRIKYENKHNTLDT